MSSFSPGFVARTFVSNRLRLTAFDDNDAVGVPALPIERVCKSDLARLSPGESRTPELPGFIGSHSSFAARGALICSFVPRMVDFHPEAIPCPYPHSSVDCDEILFYCRGNFTSRRGVGPGSISLHPAGLPHGPHPGAYEASIGHRETSELAVMLDTVRPLRETAAARSVEDAGYQESFR